MSRHRQHQSQNKSYKQGNLTTADDFINVGHLHPPVSTDNGDGHSSSAHQSLCVVIKHHGTHTGLPEVLLPAAPPRVLALRSS